MCLTFLWFLSNFTLIFCLNICGVFCVYGFCIPGCTVCLATIYVIRWSESTRQRIEVRPNSLVINIFSAIFSMFRLLKLWLPNGFIAVVSCLCLSIWINNLASKSLLRNYPLTLAFLSILRGTFIYIKLLSWLKQGYIWNIFAEMCNYITTAVHVTYYTTHKKQVIVCFHF